MQKRKSIKEQLITTTQSSKIATEERLNSLDLNERIHKAEVIVHRNSNLKKTSSTEKVIRDAFTLHPTDIETIQEIKIRCLQSGITNANKSLIVRAGIQVLSKLPTKDLNDIISSIPKIKIGRPKI